MKKQTRTRIMAVVVGIVIICGLYTVIKITAKSAATRSNPTAVANQRNYAGNGFFVQYPAKFTVGTIDVKSGMREIKFTDSDPTGTSHEYDTLYMVYIKDGVTDNSALETFAKNFVTTYSGNPSTVVTEKNVSVAGIDALQLSYNSTARGLPNDIIYTTALLRYNTAYLIQQINGNPADYLNFVSSFRFQ